MQNGSIKEAAIVRYNAVWYNETNSCMVERYVHFFGINSLIRNFWTKEMLIEKFSMSLSVALKHHCMSEIKKQ